MRNELETDAAALPVAAPLIAGRKAFEEVLLAGELALIEGEQRLRTVLSSDFLPILFHSDGKILDANAAAVELFGYSREELLEIDLFELIIDEDRQRARNYAAAHAQHPYQLVWMRKDGGRMELDVEARDIVLDGLLARVVFMRDATERLRAEAEQLAVEAQLRQAQKMEALGELAGGVAHNFNNLLTAMSGFARLLLAKLPADSEEHRYAQEIIRAAERATGLTRGLLVFSRREQLQKRTFDVNEAVTGTQTILRELIPPGIEIVTRLAPSLPPIDGDLVSFEQVLVNLAVNARDAMPAGGTLFIETDEVQVEEAGFGQLRPGRYVRLLVGDTGTGMDNATRRRIFEPFFTTKGPGQGTGLGLSTTFGIVKHAGGLIAVESRLGEGTTFTIYLPVSDRAA